MLAAPLTVAQESELRRTPEPTRRGQQAPPGYRWIAVRPGAPPPARRRPHRPGPPPRYREMPRWSLLDQLPRWSPVDQSDIPPAAEAAGRRVRSVESVHTTLVGTGAALGFAALMQLIVYGLLLINRGMLLHPVVAGVAVWLSRLASLAALLAVIGCAAVLTRWLIARRAAVFARERQPETRPSWALWAGCLVPLVNLFWAPVYLIELAAREGQSARLRKPIVVWWLLWVASTLLSAFATVTRWARSAQGIANNTETMLLGYLLAVITVVALARVVRGFERRAVDRPAHHWVVVAADGAGSPVSVRQPDPDAASEALPRPAADPTQRPDTAGQPGVLESGDREPAA